MADAAVDGTARYWAFISYSHKDAAFGRKLHRRLESYAMPRRLVGRATAQGIVPRSLVPIFRDRDELPAASDLTTEVRAALAQSRSLIVVCSPDAAASRWVSREIELFRALHPDRPVLAAVRAGEPPCCFPAALFATGPAGERIEPLAADFRPARDGAHLGLLKLVAGIAGLGLDELAQRDVQRHRQRVTAVTAGALAAVLLMGGLTVAAIAERKAAERQRAEAEGMVEFMLTDLRDRLKGVGRLDVMTAVNERALHYYEDQNLATLPVDSLERRARVLHAMGEDDENRGDHTDALAKFREAERTTATLLAANPNDPERVFDQAQSVYWMGYEDYQQNRLPAAGAAFREYRSLAIRMIALAPGKTKYRLELADADSDLCSLALDRSHDRGDALHDCGAALADAEAAAQRPDKKDTKEPAQRGTASLLTNSLANLGDAYMLNNDMAAARRERSAEEAILSREMAVDPKNMDLKDSWIVNQRALADIDERVGNINSARIKLQQALALARQIIRFDPSNKEWRESRDQILYDLHGHYIHRPQGD